MHANMPQNERLSCLQKMRIGATFILITTDFLSCGVDIASVPLVFQYDVPNNRESYIHRIGRSGRYGRKGYSIMFVTHQDEQDVKDIETFYDTKIEEFDELQCQLFCS